MNNANAQYSTIQLIVPFLSAVAFPKNYLFVSKSPTNISNIPLTKLSGTLCIISAGQMPIARVLRFSLIVFLWRTRCNKDLLYLFDIGNSHGRTGEQVRGDIENGLKFLHILMIV